MAIDKAIDPYSPERPKQVTLKEMVVDGKTIRAKDHVQRDEDGNVIGGNVPVNVSTQKHSVTPKGASITVNSTETPVELTTGLENRNWIRFMVPVDASGNVILCDSEGNAIFTYEPGDIDEFDVEPDVAFYAKLPEAGLVVVSVMEGIKQ
jgi:hypothetical protein